MKELSIEEKAKAYDEAVREACIAYKDEDRHLKATLERIFPELKESEDERIRKWITENIQETLDVDGFFEGQKTMAKNAIAWLEKQGEQKSAAKYKVGDTVYYDSFGRLVSFVIANIVEDGTDNPMYEDKNGNSIFQNDIVKQKPANKVESKFHKGDWIIHQGTENIYQVVARIDNQYQLKYGDNYTVQKCADVDRCARLWDITKDAKDGDVLCTYECYEPKIVFILKGTPKKHYALSYHCYYNIMYPHFASDSEKGCLAPNDEDVKPATKEQRDLLFQKMKQVGYEWDAEKKELKKVKKAPQKFMVGDTIKYNGTEYKITEITPNGYKVYALTYDEDAASLISFSAPAILVEQKHAWSEEDETALNNLIYALANDRIGNNRDEYVDWFKSLKQRHTWKPSDELDEASYQIGIKRVLENPESYGLTKHKWKPSDRELDAILTVIGDERQEGSDVTKELLKVYHHLKKLK